MPAGMLFTVGHISRSCVQVRRFTIHGISQSQHACGDQPKVAAQQSRKRAG